MKKLKLLTSLSALVLVLSLGACSEPTDDTPSEQDEPTSSETTPEEPEPVVLSNYTLSITLKDTDGNPVVIPFYDTVYLCGDWDNWTAFIALTDAGDESGSVLTTTLDTIKEGSHEFKGLIGNQDDEPSWSLTELILAEDGKGNATFEVAASEGDNATKNLEFTVDATKIPVLEETGLSDAEIAGLILEAAEACYDEDEAPLWGAFHGTALEGDVLTDEVYFLDDDGETYGSWVSFDEGEVDTTRYIQSRTQFIVDSEGEHTTKSYSNDYEDDFDNYGEGLSLFATADLDDLTDWEITNEEGSLIYTLTANGGDNYIVAQRAGDDFSIISAADIWEGEAYIIEVTTVATVNSKMAGFDKLDWGIASDPSGLIQLAATSGCYSVEIEYQTIYGENTITTEEYDLAMAAYYGQDTSDEAMAALEKYYALTDGDFYYYSIYLIDIYYMEDCILVYEYMYYQGSYICFLEDVVINDDQGGCWDYWTEDGGETWESYYRYKPWQDVFYSLNDAYDWGIGNYFSYYGSGTYSGVPCTAYDFTMMGYLFGAAVSWFCCLGADWWFGDYAYSYASYYSHYLTYFFEDYQALMSNYYYSYLGSFTSAPDDLHFFEEDFYFTVYAVGETDEHEEVNEIVTAAQAYLASVAD